MLLSIATNYGPSGSSWQIKIYLKNLGNLAKRHINGISAIHVLNTASQVRCSCREKKLMVHTSFSTSSDQHPWHIEDFITWGSGLNPASHLSGLAHLWRIKKKGASRSDRYFEIWVCLVSLVRFWFWSMRPWSLHSLDQCSLETKRLPSWPRDRLPLSPRGNSFICNSADKFFGT